MHAKPNQPTPWAHPAWSALAAAAAEAPAVLVALRPPPRQPRPLLPDFLRPALLAVGLEGAGLRLLAASAAASTWLGRGAEGERTRFNNSWAGMRPQQQACSTFDPSAPSALPPANAAPSPGAAGCPGGGTIAQLSGSWKAGSGAEPGAMLPPLLLPPGAGMAETGMGGKAVDRGGKPSRAVLLLGRPVVGLPRPSRPAGGAPAAVAGPCRPSWTPAGWAGVAVGPGANVQAKSGDASRLPK